MCTWENSYGTLYSYASASAGGTCAAAVLRGGGERAWSSGRHILPPTIVSDNLTDRPLI